MGYSTRIHAELGRSQGTKTASPDSPPALDLPRSVKEPETDWHSLLAVSRLMASRLPIYRPSPGTTRHAA